MELDIYFPGLRQIRNKAVMIQTEFIRYMGISKKNIEVWKIKELIQRILRKSYFYEVK